MSEFGRYGDGRSYPLPKGWDVASPAVLDMALACALAAFDGTVLDRVRTYYDPTSDYGGNLLTAVPSCDVDYVDAADLFAVTTLSISIGPLAARNLLNRGTKRSAIRRALGG